jgi:Domain of unknown function (DUF4386)
MRPLEPGINTVWRQWGVQNHTVEASPQAYARIGGALFPVIIILGAFAEGFVANKLIVPGGAATTAHNIMAAPALWQFSVAGDLIFVLCAVPLPWIEYLLLRPVSQGRRQPPLPTLPFKIRTIAIIVFQFRVVAGTP